LADGGEHVRHQGHLLYQRRLGREAADRPARQVGDGQRHRRALQRPHGSGPRGHQLDRRRRHLEHQLVRFGHRLRPLIARPRRPRVVTFVNKIRVGRTIPAMSKRIELAAAAALGGAILATGRPARATNYTITVDASKQIAGNPRSWAASVGTGTAALTLRPDLQTHYKIGNRELGFQRVRGHGVLSDDIGIYKGAGSYNWTNFDKYLDAIVLAGMRPIMEMSFMPNALGSDASNPGKSPPKDYAAYKAFIQAVVQHCVDRYTAADVGQWYWEIWNEPDYPGFWTKTMTEYYTLYDNAADAITAVLPSATIGGPGTTEPSKIAAFLQHCKTANKRVTFASSHVYPGGAAAGAVANAANLLSDNNTRRSQITSSSYTTATMKSFNTEWNSSYSGQGGGTGDVVTSMDNHWN